MLGAWLYGGFYDVEAYDFEYTNIYTHTTPTDAYRGAGRPEATYAVERTMDLSPASWGWTRRSCGARTSSRPRTSPTSPSRAA